MKLVRGTGKFIEVRDVGPVLMKFVETEDSGPVKFNGWQIMEDEEARKVVRGLLACSYKREV